jgi:putative FmdB family regulatory protein
MPTYDYACTHCDHAFEIVQSFTDDALTVCPECGGRLRKVFGSVGVVFKGSGFYRTDSRSASSSIPAGKSSDGKAEGKSSEGKSSESKSESKSSESSSTSSSGSSSSKSSAGSGSTSAA